MQVISFTRREFLTCSSLIVEQISTSTKDMYEGSATSVFLIGGMFNEFPVSIGLHQGSTLSSYLFALVMEILTRHL